LKELFLNGCQSTFAPKSIEVTVGLIKTSDAPSPRFTLMGFLTKFLLSKNSAEIRKLNLPGFSCLAKPAPKPKLPNWILIDFPEQVCYSVPSRHCPLKEQRGLKGKTFSYMRFLK
jgi:hypothetical protein